MTKSRGDKKPRGSDYKNRAANDGGSRGKSSTSVDASTLLLGTASGAVPGAGAMPSVAAMLGNPTPTPDQQMLQALLASTLVSQQTAVSNGQTYQIKCSASEYQQLQAATLAQRSNAEEVKATNMAANIAKLVREQVDAT